MRTCYTIIYTSSASWRLKVSHRITLPFHNVLAQTTERYEKKKIVILAALCFDLTKNKFFYTAV